MKKKKVVLLFADIFDLRGIQGYNRHLLNALESEFPEIKFIGVSLCDLPECGTQKYRRNIELKFCGKKNLKFTQNISFVFKTIGIVLKDRPIFLICGHVNLSPITLFLKKLYGLKYAILAHGIECWALKRGLRYVGLKNADTVTTVSRYSKNRMVANGIPESKIKILHNAVDTSLFYRKPVNENLLSQLGLGDKRILLTVGQVSSQERYKGHDIILEVLNGLDDKYVWLVIGGGDDVPRLREKAQSLGVVDKVRFLGKIDNKKLVDYYNICNVFIMPSKGEGFGIVFLEAMACGKPVIGGNKDGSAEPLMDGQLGFTVNPDSIDEIIHAINLACTAKENRTNPEYLRGEVEAHFGIQTFNKKVKSLFEKFLE